MQNKNLSYALSKFMEDWYQPKDESIKALDRAKSNGLVDEEELRKEYLAAISKEDFEWHELAVKSNLYINAYSHSKNEIVQYVKYLLQDFLFPKGKMKDIQLKKLTDNVINILKECKNENGFMSADELLENLKMSNEFHELEYYQLWNIPYFIRHEYFDGNRFKSNISYYNVSDSYDLKSLVVERKPYTENDKVLGFFRFSEQ